MTDNDGWTVVKSRKRPKRKKKNYISHSNLENYHEDTRPTTVIFRPSRFKKRTVRPGQKTIEKRYNAGTNRQQKSFNLRTIEKNIEEGNYKIKKIGIDIGRQIQQGRMQKKMKQKDLALACNLQANTIQSYENGKAVPNHNDLNKISKVLGIKLKR